MYFRLRTAALERILRINLKIFIVKKLNKFNSINIMWKFLIKFFGLLCIIVLLITIVNKFLKELYTQLL